MAMLLRQEKRPVSRLDGFQNRVAEQLFDQRFVHTVAHYDEIGVDVVGEGIRSDLAWPSTMSVCT
jgi:hypothetical protein